MKYAAHLFILIVSLSIVNSSKSQNEIEYPVIEHAVALQGALVADGSKFDLNKSDEVITILKLYHPKYKISDSDFSDKELLNDFKDNNPFLGQFISANFANNAAQDTDVSIMADRSQSYGLLSTPSPLVSNLAYGLSDFLVKRTKEELKIAFFNKLLDRLNQEGTKDVFPESVKKLQNIGDEIYDYRSYLPALQTAFRADLELLPTNAATYIRNADISSIDNDSKNLLTDALDVSQHIINEEHVHQIFNDLALRSKTALSNTVGKAEVVEIRNMLLLFGILSNALMENSNTETYIKLDQFKFKIADAHYKDLYLGLLWQVLKNNKVTLKGHVIADVIKGDGVGAGQDGLFDQLKSILEQSKLLDSYIDKLESGDLDNLAAEKTSVHYKMVSAMFAIVDNFLKIAKVDKQGDLAEAINAIESTLKIPIDIRRKNYPSAIVHLNSLLQLGLKDNKSKVAGRIMTLGTFIASIASSENPGEINAIIENHALPAGSYINKRKARSTTIELNAFVGIYGGIETLYDRNNQSLIITEDYDTQDFTLGLTAPIGVSFSWSIKNKASFSLFPYVFDLGAVVAYRFSDQTESELPELSLSNIIAPGMNLSLGIPGTPLVLAGGMQYGPMLREITKTDDMGLELKEFVQAYRYFVNLSVDIPLTTLRNGKYKNK